MFYVLRTKDFKRVIQNLRDNIQRENRENNTHYEIRLYGHGIEAFEGVEFRKDEFIRAVKENREIVYVFRNFCPFRRMEREASPFQRRDESDHMIAILLLKNLTF